MRVILPILLLAAPGWSAAAVPDFTPRDVDPAAGNVCYAVTTADVDGNGAADIVVVTEEAVLCYVRHDDRWEKRVLVRGGTPRDNVCIAAGDADRDGRVDFALGAGWTTAGSLHWIRRGAGAAADWQVHDLGPLPSTHRMRFADVLGSGRPQLVVSPLNAQAGAAGVPLTAFAVPDDPVGARWSPVLLDATLNRMHNHWHGDLDGDGVVDTLTASREGLHRIVHRDGTTTRTRLHAGIAGPAPEASGAGEVEVGRDAAGRPFVVSVEPMHGTAVVVATPPDSADGEWRRQVIDTGYVRGHAIACADLDGDGADEIVFGSSDPAPESGHGPTVAVYAAADGGWRRRVLDAGGVAVEDLEVADLTGDGHPDIVAVGRATHNVRLYVNGGR